jgi:hypothetical protein
VNGVQEGLEIVVEALAGAAADRRIGRADVQHRVVRGALDPEDLLEARHQLPELLRELAPVSLLPVRRRAGSGGALASIAGLHVDYRLGAGRHRARCRICITVIVARRDTSR